MANLVDRNSLHIGLVHWKNPTRVNVVNFVSTEETVWTYRHSFIVSQPDSLE
jgi:hypothetical protein